MRTRVAALPAVLALLGIVHAAAAREPGGAVSFTLERDTISVGDRPKVTFNRRLPAVEGERYWITLTRPEQPDSEYGPWQYIEGGTDEVQLQSTRDAGRFEVRLHDGYPRVQHHVVHREVLTVLSEGEHVSSASGGAAAARKRGAYSSGTLRGEHVVWKGLAGDADDPFAPPNWKLPDIVEVEVEGRGDELVVTLTFAHDLEQVLGQKTRNGAMKGYMLAELYLDIDGDPTTGPKLDMARERKGYDVELELSTGLELKDGGGSTTSFGSIESVPGAHTVVGTPTTYHIDDRTGKALGPDHTTWHADKSMRIRGRKLVTRVPYARLGLRRGMTVRMCFLDYTMDILSDDKVSVDAHLTLR